MIDATVGATSASGLAYCDAIGFRTWRTLENATGKRCDLAPAAKT